MIVESLRNKINERLCELYPPDGSSDLHRACHYAINPQGRDAWRPILFLAVALDHDIPENELFDEAVAYEMLHCASILLDDLPCMDNASMRRGKPCCHLVHGESTTILAALDLVVRAVTIITRFEATNFGRRNFLIRELWSVSGIIGGQYADLNSESVASTWVQRAYLKNGMVFENMMKLIGDYVAVRLNKVIDLRKWGSDIGQWHQAMDDLYDECGKEGLGGKATHVDDGKKNCLATFTRDELVEMVTELETSIIRESPGESSREVVLALVKAKRKLVEKDILHPMFITYKM